MNHREVASLLFRIWVRLHARPMCLGQLRLLWRETRRFVRLLE